ncbi:hypothetical protein ACSSS7_003601 [Eimeria intestinalis]
MEGSPPSAGLPSSREASGGSGNQRRIASDETQGAKSDGGPGFKQPALEELRKTSFLLSAGSQERGSSSRSTSSSETVESVISLAISSHASSPRSSAGDAGPTPAFSLKWGRLLDAILEDQKHFTSRSDETPDPPPRQPAAKRQAWDSLLTRDTADEAGGTGRVDPSQCRVYGPGLQERIAGVLSEFFIHAVTVDGRYASHGGARFVVYVEPVKDPHRGEEGSLLPALDFRPGAAPTLGSDGSKHRQSLAQVLDNEDGTCTVRQMIAQAGAAATSAPSVFCGC